MSAKIDPSLDALLRSADEEAVQVVLSLKQPSKGVLSSEETRARVDALLEAVRKETGEGPTRFNVFGYLGSFAVEAQPRVVRALLSHEDEIDSAVMNEIKD